jgi:pimeloyl-ACP methyl ester carboxylesterase
VAQHGYGVLDLDPRGHGLSEGAPMDLGWYGEFDVDAGVGFLSNRPEVDPTRIAVLGTSMGGEEALTTAANDPRIAAVVNEGGYCRMFDDLGPVFEHDRLQLALLPYYWTLLSSVRLTTSAQPPTPLSRAMAQTSPRPVLLIAASQEPEMTVMSHLHDVAPLSSELWLAPNTSHTQALYVHPDEWSNRVLTFLDRALLSDKSN